MAFDRHKLKPTAGLLKRLRAMRSSRLTQKEASAILGVADSTFRAFLKTHREAELAWNSGKAISRAALRRRTYQTALAGDPIMLRYVAENWLGMAPRHRSLSIDDRSPPSLAEAWELIVALTSKPAVTSMCVPTESA